MRKLLAVVCCVVALAACGSDSDDDDTAAGTTTTVAGPCPFDGSTDPHQDAGAAGSTILNNVASAVDGCIDSITLSFGPTLAASETAYEGDTLVVTLTGATIGGSAAPGEVDTVDLAYVQSMTLAKIGNDATLSITLDKKRPFLVSTSEVPAQLELSIG